MYLNYVKTVFFLFFPLKKWWVYVIFPLIIGLVPTLVQGQEGAFIENKGQWDTNVLFRLENLNGFIEITKEGYRVMYGFSPNQGNEYNLVETRSETPQQSHDNHSHGYTKLFYQFYVVEFEGRQNNLIRVKKGSEQTTIFNYYIGNDSKKWASGCKSFQDVWVENVYPNTSVHYYTKDGKFKYDIVIEAGGKVNNVKMVYKKIDKLSVDKKNRLKIQTSPNYYLYEQFPLAYEEIEGERGHLSCKYELASNTVQFKLKSNIFKNRVVLDPEFVFSTFSGAKSQNLAHCASFDKDQNFLSGSIVFLPNIFPITGNNTDYNSLNGQGSSDVSFIKLSQDGKDNLVATVIGSGSSDAPKSIKESPDGSIIIIGKTQSHTTFPSISPNIGNLGTSGKENGGDIFIVKLGSTGNLINSFVIGGSSDEVSLAPNVVDIVNKTNSGNLLIWGDLGTIASAFDENDNLVFVTSTNSDDFPIIGMPFQRSNPTGTDKLTGVIVKVSEDLNTIFYSGYLGGNNTTVPKDLVYDVHTRKYHVVGATTANSMSGAVNVNNGGTDGFIMTVSEPNSNSYSIDNSKFIGTSGSDVLYNVDIDKNSFVYVVGTTNSNSFPVVNVNYSNTGAKHFVQKYDASLSNLQFSTTFGPRNTKNPSLAISAFLIDYCENIYVAGWGGYSFNPSDWTNDFPVNANNNPLRSTYDSDGDYYTIVLERGSNSLLYGGFLGATTSGTDEHFHFGENKFDDAGILYQSVCVCMSVYNNGNYTLPNYPIYPSTSVNDIWSLGIGRNRWNNSIPNLTSLRGGSFCNTSLTKIIFDYGGVQANALASSDGGKNFTKTVKGCLPINVVLADDVKRGNKGSRFHWTFRDDGTTRTTLTDTVHHTFQNKGVYEVRLVAENQNLCIPYDTSYIYVTILEGEINLNFKMEVLDCSGSTLSYRFLNTSTSDIDISAVKFRWDFGDGVTVNTIGTQSVNHIFGNVGEYKISLKLQDTLFCKINNPADSISTTLAAGRPMTITAISPGQVCANSPFKFVSTSSGQESLSIDWGDGSPVETRTDIFDTIFYHTYSKSGNYTITMTGRIVNCNISSTTRFGIIVLKKPVVDFDFSPKIDPSSNKIVPNATVQFTNKGSNAVVYDWNFGDESASPEENTSSVFSPSHLYPTSGSKSVRLSGTIVGGCADTIYKTIIVEFIPILEIASAFSPNGDGVNDEIGIEGTAIKAVDWKIYDRKGALIFKTSNPLDKWDGRDLNGLSVPIDTYFYSAEGYFYGNHTVKKSGEITLLK